MNLLFLTTPIVYSGLQYFWVLLDIFRASFWGYVFMAIFVYFLNKFFTVVCFLVFDNFVDFDLIVDSNFNTSFKPTLFLP